MADENNGFKDFVRSEINNVKDAAERNYGEHKTLFEAIGNIKTQIAVLTEKISGQTEIRKARIAQWGTIGAALIAAAVALIVGFK
ncbi:MAG TPA: hypothetical protein VMW93_08775 [bacterium]|nr:hypothetical protein [bacterium]